MTSNTALLWLSTDPVNLLAWLELWKMRASPVFPHESALMLAKQLWQYTTAYSAVDNKLPVWRRIGAL